MYVPPGVAGGMCGADRWSCCAHSRRASPLTCLAVCCLVLTYNLMGGFLFFALEGASESESTVAASMPQLGPPAELRARTVERLWSITEDLNILYKENWTAMATKELLDYQTMLLQSLQGAPARPSAPNNNHSWTFSTSFLYAMTLITTIGHGNIMPQSEAGKLVAMVYASIGIPIIMLYLATIGEALARRVRALYSRLRPRTPPLKLPPLEEYRTPFQAAMNLDSVPSAHWTCGDHVRVPVLIPLLLLTLYVALGSILFQATEKWSLIDGCYFSFSSLATIGFGDLRPGMYASTVSAKAEDIAIGICCIYILVGIVVVAMCFSLIQDDLRAALRGVAELFACGSVHSSKGAAHCMQEKPATIAS